MVSFLLGQPPSPDDVNNPLACRLHGARCRMWEEFSRRLSAWTVYYTAVRDDRGAGPPSGSGLNPANERFLREGCRPREPSS